MSDQPGVDRPFGVDQTRLPHRHRHDVTLHHWNISDLAQGLRIIGYGLIGFGISVIISTAIVVTYLNGGTQ